MSRLAAGLGASGVAAAIAVLCAFTAVAVYGQEPLKAAPHADAPADRQSAAPIHARTQPTSDIVVTAIGRDAAAGAPLRAGSVDAAAFRSDGASGVGDLLKRMPGVTVTEGNGPRDVGLSIRGSNARIGSGVRNIVVFEDGFSVTQPNGITRLDLADPHAYRSIDVVRGPASAAYGNFALEGAVDFHTRSGRDLDGVEAGVEGGSFAYANAYAAYGRASDRLDYAAFAGVAHGGGAVGHSDYDVGTFNARATVELGARDRLTGKVIVNAGTFALPVRLSVAQYAANPYQRGCDRAADAAAGCGTITVFANGTNGARIAQTAAEAGIVSNDRRLVGGLRFEHDMAAAGQFRLQAVIDDRRVDQPSGALVSRGTLASYTLGADVVRRTKLAGMASETRIGVSYAYLDNRIRVLQRSAAGPDRLGAVTQTILGDVRNIRLFAHQELALSRELQLAFGVGAERSDLDGDQTSFAYPSAGASPPMLIAARRRFWNVAPDAQLTWRPDQAITLHARAAAGYGVPQLGQLFVTAAGVPGDNVALRAQRNRGVEVGAAVDVTPALSAELTGFAEWFRDEQVTASAGVNLLSFTTNAPRSRHRGVELGVHWRPLPGGRIDASYVFDDQRYTDFAERLTGGGTSAVVDRAGARIPGVIPHFATLRIGYDRGRGRLAGLGGFAEWTLRSAYPLDNGGVLSVPGYLLLNLGIQYDLPRRGGARLRPSLFAALRNATDRTVIGSALIVADSLDPATRRPAGEALLRGATGTVFAGQPRTLVVGARTAF